MYFSKYSREVVRVFQIREHHAKIVKLGRYAFSPGKVRQIWYQNKAGQLIYRLRPFMTVYNIPGVFPDGYQQTFEHSFATHGGSIYTTHFNFTGH